MAIRSTGEALTLNLFGALTMPLSSSVRWCSPNQPGLIALLDRIESESQRPWFQHHREQALRLALRPYTESPAPESLTPLPEESELALLYACLDYRPDGFRTLIDEIGDAVLADSACEQEHAWVAPLSRSYMDVVDIVEVQAEWPNPAVRLRSLGDGQEDWVPIVEPDPLLQKGRILLTRLVRGPVRSLSGTAIVLSHGMGHTLFTFCNELRREIEAELLAMDDWPTFAKTYGHLLLWSVAKVRQSVAKVAESAIQYYDAEGQPLLFAIAIYEHHAFRLLVQELEQWEGWEPVDVQDADGPRHDIAPEARTWVQKVGPESAAEEGPIVARITVTPMLVIIEANSPSRLEAIKRRLVAAFGFSLSFRGETTAPPPHAIPEVDLLSDVVFTPVITVSREEEHRMLASFLASVFFRWAEEPCPALGGHTPRHAVKSGQADRVRALIDQLERDDLARRRTGKPGYDYNLLRAHLGL